jgi:toxin ParE1/3/4
MKNYNIFFTQEAENDILEIINYFSKNVSINSALKMLNEIEKTCLSLNHYPERGHFLPELERIGILEYREIHYNHYRIIYRKIDSTIYINCVLDGRRNIIDLLEKRLLSF